MTSAPPHSPSSSPRLPSPPPMAEDQTGSQSPTGALGEEPGRFSVTGVDEGASRRIRPGTKAADIHEGPPLVDLADIDSPFQLTEHLKSLYEIHTHPASKPNVITPLTRETATILATPPQGTDRGLWLYELCRFLVQKANIIITSLFADNPPCSMSTCPEMRASEWQYLCAVHEPPKSCCAIDYCCHTLDWAANTLTSQKYFPSRLRLSDESMTDAWGTKAMNHPIRQLTNIFRRVYRIFAHAWFQHREVFWRVEGRTGLYILFKTVCDVYSLIPEDNYTISPEAEGVESYEHEENEGSIPTKILRRDTGEDEPVTSIPVPETAVSGSGKNSPPTPAAAVGASIGNQSLTLPPSNSNITSQTARRLHRQTPSKGSNVATVLEENEDVDEAGFVPPTTARLSDPDEPSVMETQMQERLSLGTEADAEADATATTEPIVEVQEVESDSALDGRARRSEAMHQGPSGFSTGETHNEILTGTETSATDTSIKSEDEEATKKDENMNLPDTKTISTLAEPIVKEENEDKERPIVSTGVDSSEIPVKSEGD